MSTYTTGDHYTAGVTLFGTRGEEVRVTTCDFCGAVVTMLDVHRTRCAEPLPMPETTGALYLMPVKPEPIAVDRYAWAEIVYQHRATPWGGTITVGDPVVVNCACGRMTGTERQHAAHQTGALADWIEEHR